MYHGKGSARLWGKHHGAQKYLPSRGSIVKIFAPKWATLLSLVLVLGRALSLSTMLSEVRSFMLIYGALWDDEYFVSYGGL